MSARPGDCSATLIVRTARYIYKGPNLATQTMLVLFLLFSTIAHAIVVSGPSGPWPVSHKVLELTDESRWDPYAPGNSPHKRRILTSIFVPIHVGQRKCEVDKIDYLPPKTLETYGKVANGLGLPNNTFQGFELEFCRASSKKQLPHPVVIFSPGGSYLAPRRSHLPARETSS